MLTRADIHFDEVQHAYTIGGRAWPSVTQVLNPLNELDGIPRHILDAAASFGNHVHQACHLFNQGVLDVAALAAPLVPYLEGWKQFLHDTGAKVIASEERVAHEQYGYAGTLDARVLWRKRYPLIDIKSTAVMPRTVGPQTAAYLQAWAKLAGASAGSRGRYCVQLTGEGQGYKVYPLTNAADWSVFLSALNIWKFRNKNAA